MKVKVSIPTEPVCNIKLEIEEAKCLLAYVTGDTALAVHIDVDTFMRDFGEQLAKNLGIVPEGTLFKQLDAE